MTLQIGETSPEGVRLVSTEGGAAILEVEKRRVRVGVGSQVTVTPFWAVWLFGGGVHGVVVGIPLGLIPLFFGLRLGRPKLGTIGCVATVAAGFIYGAFGAVVVSLAFVIVFVSGLPKLQTFLQAQRRPWPMMRNGLLLIAAGFALAGVLLPYENPRDASLAGYAITILAIPMFLGGVGLLIVGVISSFTRKG